MHSEIIQINSLGDNRGELGVVESGINIPFNIRRVYWIYRTSSGVVRGRHAHKNLKQLAIAVKGSCIMTLDDGRKKKNYCLNSPKEGLLIGPGMWRVMSDFSDDCVLLVLASEQYNESDYIRDYSDFLKYVENTSIV